MAGAASSCMHGAARIGATATSTRTVAVAELTKNPVEGFSAGLVDDSNIFEWAVTIIGPPDTL